MCPLGLASSGGQATQCKGHTLTRSRLQAAPELDPASSSHTQTPPPTRQPQGAGTPVSFADLESSLCSMELSPNIWLPPGQGSH